MHVCVEEKESLSLADIERQTDRGREIQTDGQTDRELVYVRVCL